MAQSLHLKNRKRHRKQVEKKMQSEPYDLEKYLQELTLDELEEIVFKDQDDFDSFLTLSEVTPMPFPKPEFEKNTSKKRVN
jgi:hypothetical protein